MSSLKYHARGTRKIANARQLVDESSATLDIVPHPHPLDRPHVLMNKFCGPEDPDYQEVSGKIERFLQEIREGTVLQRADAWIRDKHYTRERLKIVRLSRKTLLMEDCYINLAIVEQPGENRDGSKTRPEGNTAPQSSPFSRSDRLKVETPKKELQIELPTLFDSCKIPDGHTKIST